MHQQQSLINLKRKEWRVEIRKKQLEDYFQKRRVQMMKEDHRETMISSTEQEYIATIIELINSFQLLELRCLISEIIAIDPTLAFFYHLTSFNPRSPPAFFSGIIADTLQGYIKTPIHPQSYLDKELSNSERNSLKQVWQKMERLWSVESKKYISLLSSIKRIDSMSLLMRNDIIFFLSTILNILQTFQKLAQILHIPLTKQTIVGQDTLFQYQIRTTQTILNNILAGDDTQLNPFINDFLDFNGCSIENQGFFYNLFLIKNLPNDVKLKMFEYYANIIDYERAYVLENYPAITSTLYAALKSDSCPKFIAKDQKLRFLEIGERYINFFASLLPVINMRYQSYTCDEDYTFLNHMTWILNHLATESLVRPIMEAKSFHTYFLNHLNLNNHTKDQELKIISLCLQILELTTKDTVAIHYLLNQEPRFLIKFMILFSKYLNIDYQALSQNESDVLDSLLILMSSLSGISKATVKFIEEGIFHKIGSVYFGVKGQSNKDRSIRYSCEIIYLNILNQLKKQLNGDLENFYNHLFDSHQSYSMLINMLKFTQQRKNVVFQAIKNLSYIAYNCDTVSHFPMIKDMLMSPMLSSRLAELQTCAITAISEKATYIINTIKSIKYIEHPSNHYPASYDDEDLI